MNSLLTIIKYKLLYYKEITPRNVGKSSKHILSIFNDGNRVIFTITPAVKGTDSPAVSGSAVTQHPLRRLSYNRCKELAEMTDIYVIV